MADENCWREDRDREGRYDEDRQRPEEARRAYGGSSGGRFDPGSRGEPGRFGGEGRADYGGRSGAGYSGRYGARDDSRDTREREGFWGRGHDDRGFASERGRQYSREDYGSTDYGPEMGRGSYAGSFSRTGEEGRSGQGYGWQRGEFSQEASGRSFAGNEGRGFGYGSDYRSRFGGGGHGGGDGGREGYGIRTGGGDRERGFFARAADEVSSWFGDRDAEQRREQDHRGRGPKGYRRSDSRVQEDINDRLCDDPYIDASEIEVAVSNGEVTLTGTVDSRATRRRAEDVAEQVSGVSYVQNNLRVRSLQSGQGAGGSASDTERSTGQAGVGQSEPTGTGLGAPGATTASPGVGGLSGAAMAGKSSAGEKTGPNGDRPSNPI